MNMMNRLFDLVGKTWSRAPKEAPVLTLRRGAGSHIRFTVDSNHLHFHTMAYHPHLPIKQSILLDGLTLDELGATIRQMGYEATVTPEAYALGLTGRSAVTLLQEANTALDGGATLQTFTSKMWEVLYPIARLLEATEGDIDLATRQMYADSTSGSWLDYWASFFSIKRAPGEPDTSVASRMLSSINSLKTNNIAIEELLRNALLEDVVVRDTLPALFEVEVLPAFISQKELTDELIHTVKGAGIAFIYNYTDRDEEHYPSYLKDKIGKPANKADELWVDTGFTESTYGWKRWDDQGELTSFLINQSRLNHQRLGLQYVLRDDRDGVEMDGFTEQAAPVAEEPTERGVDFEEADYPVPGDAQDGENAGEWVDSYRYPSSLGVTLNSTNLNTNLLNEDRLDESQDESTLEGYNEQVAPAVDEFEQGVDFEELVYPTPLDLNDGDSGWEDGDSYRYPLSLGVTLNTSNRLNSARLVEGRTKDNGSMVLTTQDGVTVQTTATW